MNWLLGLIGIARGATSEGGLGPRRFYHSERLYGHSPAAIEQIRCESVASTQYKICSMTSCQERQHMYRCAPHVVVQPSFNLCQLSSMSRREAVPQPPFLDAGTAHLSYAGPFRFVLCDLHRPKQSHAVQGGSVLDSIEM